MPVGAVVVLDGHVIAAAHNQKETLQDPTAHAEILVLRRAAGHLGNWRLSGCALYVTLEPCPMCLGAVLQSRVDRVVYAAKDLKWGAAGTVADLTQVAAFNHRVEMTYHPLEESVALLRDFFRERRAENRNIPPNR